LKSVYTAAFILKARNVEWQNALNVEKKCSPRKPGRWQANLINRAREQNSPSVCASAAAKPLEQYSAKRKYSLMKNQTPPFFSLLHPTKKKLTERSVKSGL